MAIKLKICGNSTISDIIQLSSLDIDYIGIITDPISIRYVKPEFLSIVKKYTNKPIVNVKVNVNIRELDIELENVDYLQLHRVLSDYEIELLKSYNTHKIILYVPASMRYKKYLEKVIGLADMILVDSAKKGESVDLNVVKEFLKDYPNLGVAGKIGLDNINDFVNLNPKWIDISSSIEIFPGKKSIEKVNKIIKMVKHGDLFNK